MRLWQRLQPRKNGRWNGLEMQCLFGLTLKLPESPLLMQNVRGTSQLGRKARLYDANLCLEVRGVGGGYDKGQVRQASRFDIPLVVRGVWNRGRQHLSSVGSINCGILEIDQNGS